MTTINPIENALDADLRLSKTALLRAALRAREVARQTGTAIIISHNGIIERIIPTEMPSINAVQESKSDYLKRP